MIRVENLVTYHGRIRALDGINLEIRPGEIVSIIGSNGAGKSTLLGTVAGLYRPAQGTIVFNGEPIHGKPAMQIVRKGISLVPERRQIFTNLTVRENLVIGMYHKYYKERRLVDKKIAEVLEMFPALKKHLSHLGGTLSGGEQQMLAIGRGLMSSPKLLMLDEPSMGIAPIIVAEILKILREVREKFGMTVLLVEQNVKAALKVADRIYVMERGKIVLEGTPAEIMHNPLVQSSYLGMEKEAYEEKKVGR